MRQALYRAIDIFRARREYEEMHDNRLNKTEIKSEGAIA